MSMEQYWKDQAVKAMKTREQCGLRIRELEAVLTEISKCIVGCHGCTELAKKTLEKGKS